jgi:hypothetical protein
MNIGIKQATYKNEVIQNQILGLTIFRNRYDKLTSNIEL